MCFAALAGKTPAEAVNNYLASLQRAISCITNGVLQVSGGYHVADRPHTLAFNPNPAPILGDLGLTITILQRYRIVEDEPPRGPYKVSVVSYFYALENRDGQEILVYAWEPESSKVPFPHLHIGPGFGLSRFPHIHLPTSRIAVEDVIRLAINELGAIATRSNWEAVLERTQSTNESYRSR